MPEQDNREMQIAWAAGLFEGEGCWNVYRRKSGKRQMQARLGMTDRDVVERFADIVGFGAVHTGQPGTGSSKPVHTWCIYEAAKVRELVALFLPYMGKRRRSKAVEVLDGGADVQVRNGLRTHCPQGHPYDEANTVHAGGARRCLTCDRRRSRDRMRRKKGITPDRFRV